MPFLWLSVLDRADRGYIERNSIAVTSYLAEGHDPPSPRWLRRRAARPRDQPIRAVDVDRIRHKGELGFPDRLEQLIQQRQ